MSSSPTAPTSTTSSSTSSPSRAEHARLRTALIACGAIAPAGRADRGAPRLAGRRPPAAAAAAQPARSRSPARSRRSPSTLASAYDAVAVGLRRLRHLRRARRGLRAARPARGSPGCTATTCSPAPSGCAAFFDEPSRAPTCSPTSWCAPSTGRSSRELGLDRLPRAARRLLRQLHPRRVAGAGARPTSCGRSPQAAAERIGLPLNRGRYRRPPRSDARRAPCWEPCSARHTGPEAPARSQLRRRSIRSWRQASRSRRSG